ncbi:uncharacterized protein LOC124809360 [Hydra vulgaris]|uniref:uncharacterized protein LOC124809360 n=1 Tax=Hydra vulgaris TaxID=6087 RepID=UPI001F5E66F1|nr:uncharacterized protein LOC124809360 [Hydra vulgaris]
MMESTMYRKRRSVQPQLPANCGELDNSLRVNNISKFLDGTDFYKGYVRINNDYAHIFIGKTVVASPTDLHVDGTFKVVPRMFYQMITFGYILLDHFIPTIFILMTRRTQELYSLAFSKVAELVPNLSPLRIMTDYEQALMNTLEIQYPLAEISGCWFHYVNAVVNKCKHLGLFGLLKLQVHSDLKKWIRLLLCLSLLPPHHIQPTLGNLNPNLFVVSLSINDFAKCQSLMTYMETFWIGRIGSNKISVFGCPRRTNSDQESFHASLLKRIKIAYPNIWLFITELKKFAEVQQLDKVRLECGLQIRRRRKQKYVLNDRKIRVATENLANGRLTSLEFLQSVSHCADALFNNQLGVSRINQPPELETVSSFTQVQIEPSQPNSVPPQDEAQQLNLSIPRNAAIVQNTDDVAIVQNTSQLEENLHSSTEIVGVTETLRVVDETNGTTCPVCLENTPNFAAVPCGHMVCTMCIQLKCPRCRATVLMFIQTFA